MMMLFSDMMALMHSPSFRTLFRHLEKQAWHPGVSPPFFGDFYRLLTLRF